MKNIAPRTLLLLLPCASMASPADGPQLPADVTPSVKVKSKAEVVASPLLSPDIFKDFNDRLKAAIGKRDLAAIRELYATNGLNAEHLNPELARWRPLLEEDADARVSIDSAQFIFRDLGRANKHWSEAVRNLTTNKATHLVQVWCVSQRGQTWLYLPLLAVEDKLFIVPSE